MIFPENCPRLLRLAYAATRVCLTFHTAVAAIAGKSSAKARVIGALIVAVTGFATSVDAQSAFWSGLRAGSHEIGFRIIDTVDVTQSYPTADGAIGPRPVRLYVWYPATSGSRARRVTWGDVMAETKPLHQAPMNEKSFTRQVFQLLNPGEFQSTDTVLASSRVDSISRVPMAARMRASPAAGKYPVVLLTPGAPAGFMVSAEMLASHGFVVVSTAQRNHASIESTDFTPNAASIDAEVRDLEFALGAARVWPTTNAQIVGVMGFSTGSLSALAFAFRTGVPQAIVSIEGWEGTNAGVPIISSYRHFDAKGLKPTYLLIGKQAEDAAPFGKSRAFLDSLSATSRWRVLFESATHGDFVGLSRNRRDVFKQSNEYMLSFFQTYLEAHTSKWPPVARDSTVRIESFSVAAFAIGRDEFFRLCEVDPFKALTVLRDAKRQHPEFPPPFAEASLNRLANLMRDRRPSDALAINEIVALGYPGSARAAARYSDALWNMGDREKSVATARRALELIAEDASLPADQRSPLRARLEARIGVK